MPRRVEQGNIRLVAQLAVSPQWISRRLGKPLDLDAGEVKGRGTAEDLPYRRVLLPVSSRARWLR